MSAPPTPHPTDIVLPEPIRISPLIRLARWTALGAGIIYGYVHFYQIAKHHAAIREWEAQKFIHKVEEEKEHAEMVARKQSEFIIGLTGVPTLEEGLAGMDAEHLYPYRKE